MREPWKLTGIAQWLVAVWGLLIGAIACTDADWSCECKTQLGTDTYELILNQSEADAQQICDHIADRNNWKDCSLRRI